MSISITKVGATTKVVRKDAEGGVTLQKLNVNQAQDYALRHAGQGNEFIEFPDNAELSGLYLSYDKLDSATATALNNPGNNEVLMDEMAAAKFFAGYNVV